MTHYGESALLTDLYEITMLEAYFFRRMNDTAVFEFFVRKLPASRSFLLAAGLEQVIAYLAELRFSGDELHWLRDSGRFDPSFIASLEGFRFTGDVDAVPEGTIFFADEPILRITAPLGEAQFVESRVLNLRHYQTLVASKAARAVLAAAGSRLVDFGLRRAYGAEAGLLSARASYLAGFHGTATALAAPLFGIPVFGTMAHSFVQAHASEAEAFLAFARAFPENAVLLIDTYDTGQAAHQVVRLAQRLGTEEGIRVKGVRIDSGDLGAAARQVRHILDQGGCGEVSIFASGNLDEYEVQSLVRSGAPIDSFGIGTRMVTSADAPYLDGVYKLVEYAGEPARKRSTGKITWPGRKPVFRRRDRSGMMCGDLIALNSDEAEGEPLLRPVMRHGKLEEQMPALQHSRKHAGSQLAGLPPSLRTLQAASAYPVAISDSVSELARQADQRQHSGAECDRVRWSIDAG